jgi:hypothetical protein
MADFILLHTAELVPYNEYLMVCFYWKLCCPLLPRFVFFP